MAARQQTAALVPESPTYSAFLAGPVAVLIWHDCISVEGVDCVRRVFAALRREHSVRGFGFLTIIEEEADITTSAQVRQQLSALLAEHEPWLRAASIAYQGKGFKATIARSAITAINMASRARFPNRVFQEPIDAMRWLAAEVGTPDLHMHAQLRRFAPSK